MAMRTICLEFLNFLLLSEVFVSFGFKASTATRGKRFHVVLVGDEKHIVLPGDRLIKHEEETLTVGEAGEKGNVFKLLE